MATTQTTKMLCSLQLFLSILLAISILYGYLTYRGPIGQFAESLTASIGSVSRVLETTAETVELNKSLLISTRQMLAIARSYVQELNTRALSLKNPNPQHIEFLRNASEKIVRLGDSLISMGDGLMFSAPTNVQMEGIRPVIVMSRPMEAYGQQIKAGGYDIKKLGSDIPNIANQGMTKASEIASESAQVLQQLEDTDKLLLRLEGRDLPKALLEMKSTSENLRRISQEVSVAGNIGTIILVFGLLLAGWCFLNSLSLLMMTNQFPTDSVRQAELGKSLQNN